MSTGIKKKTLIDLYLGKQTYNKLLKAYPNEDKVIKYFEEKGEYPAEFIKAQKLSELSYEEILDLLYKEKRPLKYLKNVMGHMKLVDRVAEEHTTDPKVYVGALVGKFVDDEFRVYGMGYNHNDSYNEKELGHTYREYLFGSRDKKFRPWDKIVHAEEDAICNAIDKGRDGDYDTAIVTRYPCEKCAQLMVYKGVKTVYYGRKFKISEEAEKIFEDAGVVAIHVKDYVGDENDDNK